jgi:hypothetical protein
LKNIESYYEMIIESVILSYILSSERKDSYETL